MVVEQEHRVENPILANRLNGAVANLDAYLKTPEEEVLMEHQVDVMEAARDFFASGESGGYISLPTGSGKTVLAMELARAVGLKTVILSPTQTILRQTRDTFEVMAQDVEVSNFYQAEKDLSGRVLNTT